MLSNVAKIADKVFIIAFFLPALVGTIALLTLIGCPAWADKVCAPLASDNPFEALTYLALSVWTIAVIFLVLNYLEYRVLEGYLPPLAWIGALRARHVARLQGLRSELQRLIDAGEKKKADRLRWSELLRYYPPADRHVLPTRFGNAIRAFEFYPRRVYGADSITVWPRLEGLLSRKVQDSIKDARMQVDFAVNMMAWSLIVGVAALIKLAVERFTPGSHPPPSDAAVLGAAVVGCAVLAWFFYAVAVEAAVSWGDTIKSAFDCTLPALAKTLGYALPDTAAERRRFWKDVTRQFLYMEPIPDGRYKRASADGRAAAVAGAAAREETEPEAAVVTA